MSRFFDDLMNQMISYGGMVATRAEVYADAFSVGIHNAEVEGYGKREARQVAHRWADVYAFGPQAKIMPSLEVTQRIAAGLRFDPETGNPKRTP